MTLQRNRPDRRAQPARRKTLSLAIAFSATLAACAVGPDYHRPEVPKPPGQFKELGDWKPVHPMPAASDLAWWSIYNDPKLDELERQVAVSNESLKASEASYRQALEIVKENQAGFFPTLSATGAGTRSSAVNSLTSQRVTQNSFNAALDASWAPDIWGKIRRAVESSKASAQASAADLAAARLSIQSTLATDYFSLRIDDELTRLYEETVKAYEATLEITRNQFEAGTAAETDVITALTTLQGAQAQLVGIGAQRAQLEHAIAVLVGKRPDEFSIAPVSLVREIPVIPAGLPSTLLERRPDVAAAERTAAAASAQIGVAIAAYFPDLTLAGSIGYSSSTIGNLFKAPSQIWSVGPSLTLPIFAGGLYTAQVAAARAGYDASVADYRQTVLSAFQQVEDELSTLRILEKQSGIQQLAVSSARQAVELTIYQYEAGTVAYTNVVTVQAIALADEQNLLTTLGSRLNASVALVAALGGGWDEKMLEN
jgi:NodT family efflux transporter outer membrane factor (OMF) lipoprotein